MQNKMVEGVVRATILFFDSNPVGRIMTRFSKDMTVLDIYIPFFTILTTFGIFRVICVVSVISVIYPSILIAVVIAVYLMYSVFSYFKNSMQEIQRYDSVLRGPIHSSFTNLVEGLSSYRCYERLGYYIQNFLNQMEKSCNSTFTFYLLNRVTCYLLDWICLVFTLCVSSFTLWAKGKLDTEILAFSLQIITDVVVIFSLSFRSTLELDNLMTSSQRVYQYTQLEPEDELEKTGDKPNWPEEGRVEFKKVTMRYRKYLEPSLRELDFVIQPKMKVGIVGRTGAGKSSILQALFRLCEIEEGEILIDGINTKGVGLHLLRKNIGYIPQQPFLIKGTIRENLDPFD